MTTLLLIILVGIVLAIISLIGVVTLVLSEKRFRQILLTLVAFSAGALISSAFFNLIPESINELGNNTNVYLALVLGIIAFFFLEQFIHFHHCKSKGPKHIEAFSYLAIISDNLHNFIDGVAVAAAFILSTNLGFITAIAVIAHEIPHELGNFSILVHGGLRKKSALLLNFISSLSFLVGGIITYAVSGRLDTKWLLPFAAGNFIYIAASDLVPEIHKDCHIARRNIIHFIAFVIGIVLIYLAKIFLPE